MNKGLLIIMIISEDGVSVETQNTEHLKPEQQDGFNLIAARVHHFAAILTNWDEQKTNRMEVH